MKQTVSSPSRLMLLDTASLYYRAFYAIPESIKATDGTPVNAVRGLLDTIATLITTRRPSRMVACWDDDWRPEWRVAAVPSYKAHRLAPDQDPHSNREDTPPSLATQIPMIIEILAACGISRVGAPGFEADDIIGTLTARDISTDRHATIDIVTGDRDLFQLVDDDAGVTVLYPARGIRGLVEVNQTWLHDQYGLSSGDAYAQMAILRGDPSDGLPGVPGIGEKTAITLINRYGSIDEILRTMNLVDPRLTPSQRRRISEARDYLAVAPQVVRVATDAPLPPFSDALPREPIDPNRVSELRQRWNLGSSISRLVTAMGSGPTPSPGVIP